MVSSKENELILLRHAIAFTKLLELNAKTNIKEKKGTSSKIINLAQLSIDTELRPATLSGIFLGRSNLKATTIIQILNSLGRSYSEFALVYEKISEKDITEFKKKISQLKNKPGRPIHK